MELKKYALSDVCTIVPGFAFKSNDFGSGENIAVKIKDIEPPSVNIKNAERVCFTPQDKFRLSEGDYIMAMTGATIGKVGKLQIDAKNVYINQRVCKFNPITSVCDKEYLYYVLSTSSFRNFIYNNVDSKLAQPNIGHTTIYKYTHLFPSNIKEQKLIASVLNNIDRKIELNKLINDNLEAMAKQLYDYWFVQFDFPNEEGKPYKSSGGAMVWNEKLKREIPKEWMASNYTDLFTIGNGQTMPQNEGLVPAYGGNGIVKMVEISNYPACIIIGRVGANCGSIHYSKVPCWVSDNAISICSKNDDWQPFLFYSLKLYNLSKNKGGSSQPLITHEALKHLYFPMSEKHINQFCHIVNELQDLIYSNQQEILKFTKQRDELLPLLMNGQATINYHLS